MCSRKQARLSSSSDSDPSGDQRAFNFGAPGRRSFMRICLVLFALGMTPAITSAQLANRPDSVGLAWAIAQAIRAPIQRNGAARATVVASRTITPVSMAWNKRLGSALKGLDSTLVASRPTKETLRVNIVSLSLMGDSANANVAMSRCYADRFVGSSADYVFKRRGKDWVILSEQRGVAARGTCPRYPTGKVSP